jgi:transposase
VAREWRDVPVFRTAVFLVYAPREIACPTHGRIQEEIPWARANARVTYRLEHAILSYSQSMTQEAASRLLGLAPSTFSSILHTTIETLRKDHRIRGLRVIGIDEISYHKRHKYATIVYDLERSRVVWVGQGKGRETIDRFFNEVLSHRQKANITAAACDMSEAYIQAIRHHCPNATLVLDKFHLVQNLNKALDEVRKEEWRELTGEEKKILKGLRWMLFRHSSTRSRADAQTLRRLKRSNNRIYRAWVLKDEFEAFWGYRSVGWARRFLTQWIARVMRSRLEPLKKFARTLRRYFEDVVAHIDTGLTNAVAEGINRVIKIVKNRASGFFNLESFADLIFLVVGDLDLPAQIPARFRITA